MSDRKFLVDKPLATSSYIRFDYSRLHWVILTLLSGKDKSISSTLPDVDSITSPLKYIYLLVVQFVLTV